MSGPFLLALRLFGSNKQHKSGLQKLTDEQLVMRYAHSHDPECLGVLFERYTHLVFAVSLKYLGNESDAEDMVMQVFEKLFTELRHTGVIHFKSWLYSVTRNCCLMQLRHRQTVEKSRQQLLDDLETELVETGGGEHLIPGTKDEDKFVSLESAISQLGDQQRRCIELFYLEERSYKEVATVTGFSLTEVKSHIQNGKRNLRNFLINTRDT